MSTALYRRYRPDSFAEMIGQEHVTAPLMQALRSNRVNHAYLFSGPRGCGKTTSARILARILNCAQNTEANPTDTPCGVCPSCLELARGGSGSLDVVEIDAASHGGVDDARDLRERATFSPTRDRFKIFILDEAHMVTAQGFNALLKIVEEPPPYLKFIFATTEPEKVIGTIRSRTHHYPFKLVAPEIMLNYLVQLCQAEGISAADGVLPLVVRSGGGSVRDTLSVLDQLIAGAPGGVLEYDSAVALLGFTPATLLDEVVESLGNRNGGQLFRVIEQIVNTGHEPRRFVEDLLERLRDLLVISLSGEAASAVLPSVPSDQLARMQVQAGSLGSAELSRSADIVNSALTEMSGATSPRLHLELLCARLLLPAADTSTGGLGARIDGLERAMRQGLPAQPAGSVPNNAPTVNASAVQQTAPMQQTQYQEPQPVAPTERKSLRPDSTRRKPAEQQSQPVSAPSAPQAPGSMFAPSGTPAGVFGAPPVTSPQEASPAAVVQNAPVAASASTSAPAAPNPPAAQGSSLQDPRMPENVSAYNGPRDELGRPLAANTGWHTAQSRNPQGGGESSTVSPQQTAPQQTQQAPQQQQAAPQQAPQQMQQAAPQQSVPQQQAPQQTQQAPQQSVPQQQQNVVAPVPAQMGARTTHSPQANPEAQTAGTSGETEAFKLRWPELIDVMTGMNRATTMMISQRAEVVALDAQNLYIAMETADLVSSLKARSGDLMIAAAIKNTLGFDVHVLVDVKDSPQFPKVVSSAAPAVAAPALSNTASTQPSVDAGSAHLTGHGTSTTGGTGQHGQQPEATSVVEHSNSVAPLSDPLPPLGSTNWTQHNQPVDDAWNAAAPQNGQLASSTPVSAPAQSAEHNQNSSSQGAAVVDPNLYTGQQPQTQTASQSAVADWDDYVPEPPADYDSVPFDAPTQPFDAPTQPFAGAEPVQVPGGSSEIQSPQLTEARPGLEYSVPAEQGTQAFGAESSQPTAASAPAFDPMASVNIFGAAIGALANARSVAAPELPRIADAVESATARLTATTPRVEQPVRAGSAQTSAQASDAMTPVEGDVNTAGQVRNDSGVEPQVSVTFHNEPQPVSAPSAPSTIPPWEAGLQATKPDSEGETPRQAAERRAAVLAAEAAARVAIVDDPQPDDEDLDANNLVGVPLVMSMFGATVIEEITDAY